MNLPGEPLRVTDSADLCIFLQDVCETCRHQEYCSILAHAGMYGSASEWRTVEDKMVCIHQEDLPVIDRTADPQAIKYGEVMEREPWRRGREPEMDLPEGKTCGDCIHFQRCNKIYGHIAADEVCDWAPSRFSARSRLG